MKPITIAGGGLTGLTLGIGLRQRGVPVSIREAGHYPRHRVCGEFISGNGPGVLERLGLRPLLVRCGAVRASRAVFVAGAYRSPVRTLASFAWCVSRHTLDAMLAEEFRRLGGDLLEHARWEGDETADGVIRATGRKPVSTANGWRWFGLKVHAHDVPPGPDVEMHLSADGYVGINRVNEIEVNVCGLFRARKGSPPPLAAGGNGAFELLRGRPGSALRERLKTAVFDEASFCSVAGLALQPRRATDRNECCLGDALTMIAPVTGNGMSMALESAELALDPVVDYSAGDLSWAETRRRIATSCDAAFARRLNWARWLHWLTFSPIARSWVGGALLQSNQFWNLMFSKTR